MKGMEQSFQSVLQQVTSQVDDNYGRAGLPESARDRDFEGRRTAGGSVSKGSHSKGDRVSNLPMPEIRDSDDKVGGPPTAVVSENTPVTGFQKEAAERFAGARHQHHLMPEAGPYFQGSWIGLKRREQISTV